MNNQDRDNFVLIKNDPNLTMEYVFRNVQLVEAQIPRLQAIMEHLPPTDPRVQLIQSVIEQCQQTQHEGIRCGDRDYRQWLIESVDQLTDDCHELLQNFDTTK